MKRTIETDIMSDLTDDADDADNSEEEDVGSDDDDNDGPPAKQQRLENTDFTAPSANELNKLKEAENLFQSNLFKLQVTELLAEVCLKEKRKHQIECCVKKLKKVLTSLPCGQSHELDDQKWLKELKVKLPFVQLPKSCKGEFHFAPPDVIESVGSFSLGTCIKPDIHVDLVAVVPKECIQSRDYLNQRYLRKRALYLAVIAAHLKSSPVVSHVKFSYHQGNRLRPFLIIAVNGEGERTADVHLHVGLPPDGALRPSRFSVNQNNVRRHWFYQVEQQDSVEDAELSATPAYNSAVLQDLLYKRHHDYLQPRLFDTHGLSEGLTLLKIWLRQRELDKGYGCFSGFVMSMYVGHLLDSHKLHPLMSSYQVLRNTLVSLASTDWLNNPPSMCDTASTDSKLPSIDVFRQQSDVVFVDPTGYLNLCANMSAVVYKRVKHEANLAIKILESSDVGSFETLLLKPVPFVQKFDQCFHLTDTTALKAAVVKLEIEDRVMDTGGHYVQASIAVILKLMERALGDRVHLVQPALQTPPQWEINKLPPDVDDWEPLTFGLLLNSDTATSVLDKGPPAQSPEAVEFRELWGDKSELRRFQDASIHEAVVWTNSTLMCKRRMICSKVIKYILNSHAGIPADVTYFMGHQLDPLLHLPKPKGDNSLYGTGEEEHVSVIQSLDELSKMLHKLDDLPLGIKSVQGVSPVFRFAEVFPAMPAMPCNIQKGNTTPGSDFLPVPEKNAPFYLPTLQVMCRLEGSGKWPDDLEAIRRVKAAFYIQLFQVLRKKGLYVRLHPAHLDVLKDGYVFRLLIGNMREITLAKTTITPEGSTCLEETAEAVRLQRDYMWRPKLTSSLYGLQQQHNTYSSAARLAKRWLSAHMLLDHMTEEAVELLVAHAYVSPAPYTVPGSPIAGFLRFLTTLGTHDWKSQPLFVNLNNEFTKDALSEISTKFEKERGVYPLLCISTPQDPRGGHWTEEMPTAPVLQRTVVLARESLQLLQSQLITEYSDTDFRTIFRPPLDIFDVLIYMKKSQLPRHHQAVDITTATNIPKREMDTTWQRLMPVTGFDPVQYYLAELRECFGDVALFFHDRYGGSTIGVLWKPAAKTQRYFEDSKVVGCMPDINKSDDVMLKPNLEAAIVDFELMGKGLVAHIKQREKEGTK